MQFLHFSTINSKVKGLNLFFPLHFWWQQPAWIGFGQVWQKISFFATFQLQWIFIMGEVYTGAAMNRTWFFSKIFLLQNVALTLKRCHIYASALYLLPKVTQPRHMGPYNNGMGHNPIDIKIYAIFALFSYKACLPLPEFIFPTSFVMSAISLNRIWPGLA